VVKGEASKRRGTQQTHVAQGVWCVIIEERRSFLLGKNKERRKITASNREL
jgi:hypothetical protein